MADLFVRFQWRGGGRKKGGGGEPKDTEAGAWDPERRGCSLETQTGGVGYVERSSWRRRAWSVGGAGAGRAPQRRRGVLCSLAPTVPSDDDRFPRAPPRRRLLLPASWAWASGRRVGGV